MYLIYVDESGDTGHLTAGSQTDLFVLNGIVIHELRWKSLLEEIIQFRRSIKASYGIKINDEIHCRDLFHNPGRLGQIPKYRRLLLIKEVLEFQARLADFSTFSIIIDKRNKPPTYDIFERAWTALLQRFHNTIQFKNFPGPQNAKDYGLVLSDATDGAKLTKLIRKLRKYNFVPSMHGNSARQIPLDLIVEDPISRDSKHSLVIQLCDVNAHALFQNCRPNKYYRKKGAKNWYKILAPVANTKATQKNKFGVVVL